MSGSDDVLGRALDRTLLRRIFAYVWPYKLQIGIAVLLLPITSGLEIAQPYLLKKAIDEHIARGRLAGLDRLGVFYLLALIGQYGASFGQTYLTQLVGQRAMNDLRLRLHQHVLSLASSFFDRTPIGRLMTRITSDVEALNEMFASGLVSLLGDVIRLSAILIAIFGIDWKLALFSMGSAPVLFAIAAVFRRCVRDAFRDIRTKLARLNAFLQEHISGMKVVQAFAREERVAARFDEINGDYRRANYRAIAADAALYSVIEALASIAIAGLVWHGGARIAGGTLTFGVLVAFIEYLSKFFGPIRDLSAKYTIMQQAMAAAERVFGLLDTHEPDAPVRDAPLAVVPVSRRRSAHAADRDRRRHLRLPPRPAGAEPGDAADLGRRDRRGRRLDRLGQVDADQALPRLYEPWSGAIRLGGADVRDMDRRALRRRIVVVSQDVFLFAGTLGDNIGLRRPEPVARGHPGSGATGGRRPRDRAAARGARRAGAGARRELLGGRAPADLVRARPVPRPRDPDPGRGDGQRRSRDRAPHRARNGRADARPHVDRDRAPPVDDPARHAHHRSAPGPHCRGGKP